MPAKHVLRTSHVLMFLAAISVLLAAVAHSEYENSRLVAINSITPILYPSTAYGYQNGYSLGGLSINVSSNYGSQQNVSFYIVSQGPNLQGYILSVQLPGLQPHGSTLYNVSYQLPPVDLICF